MVQADKGAEETTEKSGELRRVKEVSERRIDWAVVGEQGALHFWMFTDSKYRGGGVEEHRKVPPDYMRGDAPTQDDCWLIGCPCWHDGSSLYADPFIETLDALGEDGIWRRLESEYRERFVDRTDEQPAKDSA